MKEDLFTYLPTEIITTILSRLPIPIILRCKCVCKSWLNLIESREFSKAPFSKLVVFCQDLLPMDPFKVLKFVDERDPAHPTHCCTTVLGFNFPYPQFLHIHSSIDGLLFLWNYCERPLYICNPITRDYVELPHPSGSLGTFGFGVSKMSGKYKLVKIEAELVPTNCQVYTLGTGSWRSIAVDGLLKYIKNDEGVFLNGNLHWLAFDSKGSFLRISCFDLETELFSTFAPPPNPRLFHHARTLTPLDGRLCLCDNSGSDEFGTEIVFWVMKEYGDEKSWTKEFVFGKSCPRIFSFPLKIVKVFNDGEILISTENGGEVFSLSKTNNTRVISLPGLYGYAYTSRAAYTPSFLSIIRTFVNENVSSF